MNYQGVIIEESLKDTGVLDDVKILSTDVEEVTASHKTPWLKQWTLHNVEIKEPKAEDVAKRISQALQPDYWYADFKNSSTHFVIFPDKVFKVNRDKPEQYKAVTAYGLTLGIPAYQLDFAPIIKQWQRPEK